MQDRGSGILRYQRPQELILKVKVGLIGAMKTLRFEAQTTVREAVQIIATRSNLNIDGENLEEQYVLFKPTNEVDGVYLENYSAYLSTAIDLQNNDLIEFRRKPHSVTVRNLALQEEQLLVDFLAPTSEIIVFISKKYGYKEPDKLRLFSQQKPDEALSPGLSLNEQDIPHNACIIIQKRERRLISTALSIRGKITRPMSNYPATGVNVNRPGAALLSGSAPKQIFGGPLTTAVNAQGIPPVMEKCIRYIEEKALDKEGIFRLSGSAIQISDYKKQFNSGVDVNLNECLDPHVVCGLLKQYLRELPEPLLTFALYDAFIDGFNQPPERHRELIKLLPKENVVVLKRLLKFLAVVVSHSAENKMPIHNIATVFAPNLLRMRDENVMRIVQDTPAANGLTAALIKNHELIFTDESSSSATPVGSTSGNGSGIRFVPLSPAIPKNSQPELEVVPASLSTNNNNTENDTYDENIEWKEEDYVGYARVLYDYEAQDEQELTLRVGDLVGVLQKHESGWWKGELHGQLGLFPVTYCEEVAVGAAPGAGMGAGTGVGVGAGAASSPVSLSPSTSFDSLEQGLGFSPEGQPKASAQLRKANSSTSIPQQPGAPSLSPPTPHAKSPQLPHKTSPTTSSSSLIKPLSPPAKPSPAAPSSATTTTQSKPKPAVPPRGVSVYAFSSGAGLPAKPSPLATVTTSPIASTPSPTSPYKRQNLAAAAAKKPLPPKPPSKAPPPPPKPSSTAASAFQHSDNSSRTPLVRSVSIGSRGALLTTHNGISEEANEVASSGLNGNSTAGGNWENAAVLKLELEKERKARMELEKQVEALKARLAGM